LYLIHSLSSIIVGIVCIAIASAWTRKPSKWIFIAFVACSFIISGCLSLVINWLYSYPNSYLWRASLWGELVQYVNLLFGFLSTLLLIIYVVLVKNESVAGAPVQPQPLTGPSWDTDLNKKQLTAMSSKRNLAFVIDYAPIILGLVAYIYWLSFLHLNSTDNFSPFGGVVATAGLGLLGLLAPLYILFKDAFGGQSIGKRFFDCRVVHMQTGQPVGAGESIIRNLIFVLPFGPLIELVASTVRKDKKRFGDLMSGSQVVTGPPQFVDGVPVATKVNDSLTKHALDD